jgi:hypothetical protein
MNYFTPELLERFRSQDDQEAETAADEWEAKGEAYVAYLRSVAAQLPAPLRQLLENYYLHDAEMVFAAVDGTEFQVTLKLDTPPHDSLLLTYKSVDAVQVIPHPPSPCSPVPVVWLYDEVEIQHDQAAFKHSILLSNGWDLRISFRDFSFRGVSNRQVLVSGSCQIPQVALPISMPLPASTT